MSNLDSKRRQFKERLDTMAGSRPPPDAGETGIAGSLEPALLERIQAWESSLDQRLVEFSRLSDGSHQDQKSTYPPDQPSQPNASEKTPADAETTLLAWFQSTDANLMEELEWKRHPLPAGFQNGFELITSDKAMQVAIAHACGLGAVPAGMKWKEYQLGVFHIPGHGTLINPAHYAWDRDRQAQPAKARFLLAKAVSDLAMERWGWGFLLEYTSIGKRAGAAGLWPAMLADRAGLPYADQDALQTARAIHRSWILLKNGWMDWVWQYVMYKSHRPIGALVDRPRPSRIFELFMRLQGLFPLYLNVFDVRVSLRPLVDLVKFIFLEQTEISPKVLNEFILGFQNLCLKQDDKVQELVDLPLSRMLGRLYFSWLENQVGILSTPYALLIAAHEPQFDFSSSASQFVNYVEQDPRHNPDARLAMLTRLDGRVKYNPHAMFTAAWERLKLEGPRDFFTPG